MSSEMRLGERVPLEGDVNVHLPDDPTTWSIQGYDVSPTAVAIVVPVDHELMDSIPHLLKPGSSLMIEHDVFGQKKCILHRVFRHRNETTKWVLSFLHKISIRED